MFKSSFKQAYICLIICYLWDVLVNKNIAKIHLRNGNLQLRKDHLHSRKGILQLKNSILQLRNDY